MFTAGLTNLPGRFAASLDPLFFDANGRRLMIYCGSIFRFIELTGTATAPGNRVVAIWGVYKDEEHVSMWRMTINREFEIVEADETHGRHEWVLDDRGVVHTLGNQPWAIIRDNHARLRDPGSIISPWFTVLYPDVLS